MAEQEPERAGDERGRGQPELAGVLPFPSLDRPDDVTAPEPELRALIGAVLRAERLGQGRTLADVADDANVSLPYLSEIERGRKEISSELLTAVIDALDLPLTDVLERCTERLRLHAGAQRGSGVQLRAA